MKIKLKDITESFLRKNDGKLVWIRWDWLCMRNISPLYKVGNNGYYSKVLDKVEKLKNKMISEGYRFNEN